MLCPHPTKPTPSSDPTPQVPAWGGGAAILIATNSIAFTDIHTQAIRPPPPPRHQPTVTPPPSPRPTAAPRAAPQPARPAGAARRWTCGTAPSTRRPRPPPSTGASSTPRTAGCGGRGRRGGAHAASCPVRLWLRLRLVAVAAASWIKALDGGVCGFCDYCVYLC